MNTIQQNNKEFHAEIQTISRDARQQLAAIAEYGDYVTMTKIIGLVLAEIRQREDDALRIGIEQAVRAKARSNLRRDAWLVEQYSYADRAADLDAQQYGAAA